MSSIAKLAKNWACHECRDVGLVAEEIEGRYSFRRCPCDKGRRSFPFMPQLNSLRIPVDESLESLKKRIGFFPDELRDSVLIHRQLQRELIKLDAVKNPDKYRIFRPLKEGFSSGPHFLSRNPFFVVIANQKRKMLTQVDKVTGVLHDRVEIRSFRVWGKEDVFCTLTGAPMGAYDQKVYDAIVSLFHKNRVKGLILDTSFSELWREMGYDNRPGKSPIEAMTRALKRMSQATYYFNMDGENIKGVEKKIISTEWIRKNDRLEKLRIHIGQDVVTEYFDGLYATFSMKELSTLSDFAYKILRFCMANEGKRIMTIDSWRECIGIDVGIEEESKRVPDKELKRKLKEATKELVERGFSLSESGFAENSNVLTVALSPMGRSQERVNLLATDARNQG